MDLETLMLLKTKQGLVGYVCLICGQTCKQKAHIKRHMKEMHTKPVHYECPTCKKRFVNRSFEKHVRAHHPDWAGVDLHSFEVAES